MGHCGSFEDWGIMGVLKSARESDRLWESHESGILWESGRFWEFGILCEFGRLWEFRRLWELGRLWEFG